jgi:HEAT repeats
MKRRGWLIVVLLGLGGAATVPFFDDIAGFLRGEPRFEGRTLNYWRNQLRLWHENPGGCWKAPVPPKRPWFDFLIPGSREVQLPSADTLVALLQEADSDVRLDAGEVLIVYRQDPLTADSVRILSGLLRDHDVRIRMSALYALRNSGATLSVDAIPALIDCLDCEPERHFNVAAEAANQLRRIGRPALPGLLQTVARVRNRDRVSLSLAINAILAIDPTMIGHPDVAAARQEMKNAHGC